MPTPWSVGVTVPPGMAHRFRDSPQLRTEIPRRMVAGDYVVDEEELSGFILAGFPPAMRAVVVYRVREASLPMSSCSCNGRLPARVRERSTLTSVRTCPLG